MERLLATVRKINDIQSIPGADMIECAIVDGWKLVVKKGEFQINDLAVYCEIDSFLPVKDEFEFLRKSSYRKLANGNEGFRLRTVKLRGQISQGLLLPLSVLSTEHDYYIGEDVTDALGITLYEASIPVEISGDVVGSIPSVIRKTDEERIQNLKIDFERFKQYTYHAEEKLDGTSCTFFFNAGEMGVCGRNWQLKEEENSTLWRLFNESNLKDKLSENGANIAIQGEVIGNGIQGNKYKLNKQEFRIFNVWDIDSQKYLPKEKIVDLAELFGLKICPIVYQNGFVLPDTIDELLQVAEGKSSLNPNIEREGLVFVADNSPEYISFKVINNKFLLKFED